LTAKYTCFAFVFFFVVSFAAAKEKGKKHPNAIPKSVVNIKITKMKKTIRKNIGHIASSAKGWQLAMK